MRMTDLLPATGWRDLERELHAKYDLNAHAYDEKGNLFTGESLPGNRLCPAIRSGGKGAAAICAVANSAMLAEARKTGKPVIDACDAGLVKITVPVMAGGAMIGAVGGCGRLPAGGEVDAFLVYKAAGLPEAQVKELAGSLKPMTRAEAEVAAEDIRKRVAAIVAAAGKK